MFNDYSSFPPALNGDYPSHYPCSASHPYWPNNTQLGWRRLRTVFMGAMTYTGNGPNLMVKAISEQAHFKMPSFGGYLLWSGSVLFPLLLLITMIFFLN